MADERSSAQLYLRTRAEFRDRAARSFFSAHPGALSLMAAANELVAGLSLFASRKNFRALHHGIYISDLLVSFCRTHFLAVELIAHVELIDAGLLIRKQMELVARFHELSSGADIDFLVGKTPNVKHLLDELRPLYGEYSKIAHSSDHNSLLLLGRVLEDDAVFTPLYPVFDANAYVALTHLSFIVTDFYLWAARWYRTQFLEYEQEKFNALFQAFLLTLREFCRMDLESIRCSDTQPTATRARSMPGVSPATSPESACGRADFLALAVLIELRRRNLERFASLGSGAPSSENPPDEACRLFLGLAYQQAIACVNFVANSVSTQLSGEGNVDDLFSSFALSVGIERPISELEAQAVAELKKMEGEFETQLVGCSRTPLSG